MTRLTVELPITLPMGDVFGNRDLTERNGHTRHLCWVCATNWQRGEYWPPMPPGCCLCARCGVLIYTGRDDPSNTGMDVCRECERALAADAEQGRRGLDDEWDWLGGWKGQGR